MKLIKYGDEAWLIDDRAAEALMQRATHLARTQSAEALTASVVSVRGKAESVSLLLGPATMMSAEAIETEWDEPDNSALMAHLRATGARSAAEPDSADRPISFVEDI